MPLEKEKLISAEKARQLLISGDFPEYLKYLYQLGIHFEENFVRDVESGLIDAALEGSDKRKIFYNYISNRVFDLSNFPPERVTEEKLVTSLWNLKAFLVAWEDSGLCRKADNELRHAIKSKKDIDKSIRRAIHAELIAEALRVCKESYVFYGKKLSVDFSIADKTPNEICLDKLSDAIELLSSNKPQEDIKPKGIEQIFKKAAKAISSFKSFSDKLLQALGVFIAFLAALACGLTVGGCAYLLFMGLTPVTFFLMPLIPAAIISIIGASIVFGVNFSYLYKSIPEVLLSAAKMGGITEYIDPEGKRAQLSRLKKILLLPAAIVSFAVGVSMMAFTATNFISILAGIIPALALSAAPPFLPILLGILIVGLGVALSILMFKGFVWLLQKPLIKLAKQALDHMKKLFFLGWLGLSIKLLIFGLSVVGIYALYFAGIPILVPFFGPAAVLIGWASFFGELPFTLMVVSQLCDLVGSFLANNAIKIFNFCFTRQNVAEQLEDTSTQEKTSFKLVIGIFFVTINAFLNALLVIGTTIISLVATGACFVNSFASNLIVPNSEQEIRRSKANDACLQALMPKNKEVISSRQNDNLDAGRNEPLIISSSSLFITPKSAQQNMNGYCANNMVTPQTVGSTRYNAGL